MTRPTNMREFGALAEAKINEWRERLHLPGLRIVRIDSLAGRKGDVTIYLASDGGSTIDCVAKQTWEGRWIDPVKLDPILPEPKMYICLFHGRKANPSLKWEEELADRGEDGPVFELADPSVSSAYCNDIKFYPAVKNPGTCMGWLTIYHGLVYYDGMFYGDWSIYSTRTPRQDSVPFDREKADLGLYLSECEAGRGPTPNRFKFSAIS